MSKISTAYAWHDRSKKIGRGLCDIAVGSAGILAVFGLAVYLATMIDNNWVLAALSFCAAVAIWMLWNHFLVEGLYLVDGRRMPSAPGTSRMATKSDLQKFGLFNGNPQTDVYCGMFQKRPVYYGGDAHCLVTGETRSGKDMRFMVENIRHLKRSLLIMDPKGELAVMTAADRQRFGKVLVINPFNVLVESNPHLASVGFNPMIGFTPDDPEFFSKSMAIAEALIQIEGTDPHWSRRGQALIAALVMGVKWDEKEGKIPVATMGEVKSRLAMPYKNSDKKITSLYDILKRMANHPDPQAADTAKSFLSEEGSKEIDGAISAAQGQVKFLNDGTLIRDLSMHPKVNGKPFDFRMLKEAVYTVYLILPVKKLETHSLWLRLLVSNAIDALSDIPGPVRPVLMLNEAGNLGHLKPLERGMAILAGMGVTLWTLWQSHWQIKKIYGDAGAFTSGSGFIGTLTATDMETPRYFSDRSGKVTIEMTSYNLSPGSPKPNRTDTPQAFPLIHPEQITGLAQGKAYAWVSRCPYPISLDVPGHWDIKGPRLDPNPYYIPPGKNHGTLRRSLRAAG